MQISDFTIGLGLDSKAFEQGMKSATSGLNNFKSAALQVGATLLTAFSANALTFDFAKDNNELQALSLMLRTTRDDIYALDQAGQAFGADGGAMVGTLKELAQARANFQNLGELGFFGDLAKLGVDINPITGAKTEMEALYALADELSKLDSTRAAQVAGVLGLSPEQLMLLRQGRESMKKTMDAYKAARKHTDEMANASAGLLAQWNLLTANIGGRADQLSVPLVSAMTDIIDSTNKWFDANRKVIDQNIAAVFSSIGGATVSASSSFEAFMDTLEPLETRLKKIGTIINEMIEGFGGLGKTLNESIIQPVSNWVGEKADAVQGFIDEAKASNGNLLDRAMIFGNDGLAEMSAEPTPNYWDPTNGTEALGYSEPRALVPSIPMPGINANQPPIIEAHIHIGNETVKETVRTEVKSALQEAIDLSYGTTDR